MADINEGLPARVEALEARIKELLEANTREVNRRRALANALRFYADPHRARDDKGGAVVVPDLYDELDFGHRAKVALDADELAAKAASQPPAEPLYYVHENAPMVVYKRPIYHDNRDGGKTITIGFPVCTAHECIGPKGAKAIAAMLSFAEGAPVNG